MLELCDNPTLAGLLNQYESMGGIVEHVVLAKDDKSNQEISLHRHAALRALEILGQRLDQYYERLLLSEDYKHRQRGDFFAWKRVLNSYPVIKFHFLNSWDPASILRNVACC